VRHSTAFIQQAISDLEAGQSLFNLQRPDRFCQAISKYQQAVEKAIKGLAAVLHHGGIIKDGPGRGHPVDNMVSAILKAPR
jgi:HEPN domain-containing protein